MSSEQRYQKATTSSTRDSQRPESYTKEFFIKSLMRKLKDAREAIKDLKNVADLNKQALKICIGDQTGDSLIKFLFEESEMLMQALVREFSVDERQYNLVKPFLLT